VKRIVVVLGVTALLAAVAALVAGTALAQPKGEHFQIREPITFTDYNPCTGEEILWEGIHTSNIHVTTNATGRHVVSNFTIMLTGTGLETGDEYRGTGASGVREHQLSTGPSDTPRYVYNETSMGVTISKGGSPNALGRYQVRVTQGGYVEVLSRECTTNVEPQWPEEPVE
jgi:hypothetical protein